MPDKKELLSQKKEELEELRRARSGATCTFQHSSTDAVSREMRIEELEDEIKELEKELAG
jgi:ribosomal protein L29